MRWIGHTAIAWNGTEFYVSVMKQPSSSSQTSGCTRQLEESRLHLDPKLDGKLLVGSARSVTALVMGTVNAPMRLKMTPHDLAESLKQCDLTRAHINCFFWEVPLEAQRIFARAFNVAEEQLLRSAFAYSRKTNRPVPLLTGEPTSWERIKPPPKAKPILRHPRQSRRPVRSLLEMPGARAERDRGERPSPAHPAPLPR